MQKGADKEQRSQRTYSRGDAGFPQPPASWVRPDVVGTGSCLRVGCDTGSTHGICTITALNPSAPSHGLSLCYAALQHGVASPHPCTSLD
eukprot:scaffold2437_cov395-Prasinococcus_capsulatus_cf.AAC.13